ncbi:unnamed protein product [Mytilus coruscus]|uniref:Uncharacterized protein n=1 Tax=Mytilus coruscus TaxID=42192 RepID=A0A6J8C4C8_MYTCO|nr:unnamed protein product [Mytilus coruscus]
MDSESLCNSSEDLFFFKTRNKYPYNSSTYGSSSSGDTFNLKLRNGKLRTAINALTDAFKMVMETIDHLIQKPVDILMAGVDSENSTNRTTLKKSETELQKVAFLLQHGLKRMREAMQEQSRAIKVLSELEQFTPGQSKSPDVEQSSVKSETINPLSEMDQMSEQQENEQTLAEKCKIQNQWEAIQQLLDADKTNAQTVCNHQQLELERNSEKSRDIQLLTKENILGRGNPESTDNDPKLQQFDGKSLSTFSKEDLMQVATKTKLQLNDILMFLDIDDSRENLCKVRERKNLILSRFHIHKNRPNFAVALLLKLVCNNEEEAVLDKEQKLLEIFGKNDVLSDNYNMQSHNLYLHAAGSFEQAQGQTDGMPPRFLGSPRRRRPRDSIHNVIIKPGHFVCDCPVNQVPTSLN